MQFWPHSCQWLNITPDYYRQTGSRRSQTQKYIYIYTNYIIFYVKSLATQYKADTTDIAIQHCQLFCFDDHINNESRR